jgi:hypothetical protein|tara:strand:+ start:320 stop:850 length:531 start_codon:yes stop_codon:yes gene_type:complete
MFIRYIVPDKKPDGRTYAAGKPKQVTKQQSAKRSRCHRKRMKAEVDMKQAQKELASVEQELDIKKQFLDTMSKAPTPAEQRKALLALFAERGVNPIEELLQFTEDPDIKKTDKIAIWKELASFTQPKLKSVDVQANVQGEMKILTVDYSKVIKDDIINVTEDDYEEFLSDQDKNGD